MEQINIVLKENNSIDDLFRVKSIIGGDIIDSVLFSEKGVVLFKNSYGIEFSLIDIQTNQDVILTKESKEKPYYYSILFSDILSFESSKNQVFATNLTGESKGWYFSNQTNSILVKKEHPTRLVIIRVHKELLPRYVSIDNDLKHLLDSDGNFEITKAITGDMKRVLYSLFRVVNKPKRLRDYFYSLYIWELFLLFVEQFSFEHNDTNPAISDRELQKIYQVETAILSDASAPKTIKELAQIASMSSTKLASLFKLKNGITINQYSKKFRLNQAKTLLMMGQMSAGEVAHAVGYTHLGHFSQEFKKRFGVSPSYFLK